MKTSRGPSRVTLPRALSKLGHASRTQAFVFIHQGRVTMNGGIERNPHRWVNLQTDTISVDGKEVFQEEFRYLLFHKPAGVRTTRSDEHGNPTVYDLLGEKANGLFSVGRLDKETSGFLLLTNDNQLANALTNPEIGITKTYQVLLDKLLDSIDAKTIQTGVTITIDGRLYVTKPAKLVRKHNTSVVISITEGKNRQIRKMFQALGYEVLELHRQSLGSLTLAGLKEKESRQLTKSEIKALRAAVAHHAFTRDERN